MPKRKRKASHITKKKERSKRKKLHQKYRKLKKENFSDLEKYDLPFDNFYEKNVVSDGNCYYRCNHIIIGYLKIIIKNLENSYMNYL